MERKRYLQLCQKRAVGEKDVFVIYEGVEYIPISLSIWFNKKGETQNTAVLRDLNGKTFVNCRVIDIDE